MCFEVVYNVIRVIGDCVQRVLKEKKGNFVIVLCYTNRRVANFGDKVEKVAKTKQKLAEPYSYQT